MKNYKQIHLIIIAGIICFAGIIALSFSVWTAFALDDQQEPNLSKPDDAGQKQGAPPGRKPPPGAFTACEGKNVGDSAQDVSPRGDTVTGTCQDFNGTLALRPDRPKRQ
jgi:hypothetical protein